MGTIETNLYPEKSETEGNKVLAEFMGFVPEDKPHGTVWRHPNKAGVYGGNGIKFTYFTSWQSLMPVWIKFRDLEFTGKNEMLHSNITANLFHALYNSDSPSDFFPHLVEAVKWYQSTKKIV